ncbi:MAG: FAD-dependent thymidylate synthase [Crenarchaeota archaeon]|nr:FAD-dependent thymidylate synthase [Thermoproteota archaeon]
MRVILWAYFPDAEEILSKGAWATVSHSVVPDIKPRVEDTEKIIKLAKTKKLSSILDFPYYVFSIEDVSRIFTHQWVRYRIAAHMQQSLRYVKIDTSRTDWFVIPPSILKAGVDSIEKYVRKVLEAGRVYEELTKVVDPEDARFIIPMSVKTHISSAFDAEEMIHIITQRTCYDAQWEIRNVAWCMLLAGLIVHPRIFEGVGPHCLNIIDGRCRGFKRVKDCEIQAKQTLDIINRIASEQRRRFEELKAGEVLKIDLTEHLGYVPPPEFKNELRRRLGLDIDPSYNVVLEIVKR